MTFEEFRNELDDITKLPSADEDWWPAITELQDLHPHSIRRLKHETEDRYLCFMYALGLHTSAKHRAVCEAFDGTIFADTCFFLFLKKRRVLQLRHDACPESGDLVVYINHGLPLHIGVAVSDSRVISKWGTGLLLEHEILEVPATYGTEIEIYEAPDFAAVERLFEDYGNFVGGAQ